MLAISEYDTLFNLIGTTFGGDGQSTFALPDLQGRIPIHAGQGPGISRSYQFGEKSGTEVVTLTSLQIPAHSHGFDQASLSAKMRCQTASGTQVTPVGNVLAREAAGTRAYVADSGCGCFFRCRTTMPRVSQKVTNANGPLTITEPNSNG